MGVVVSLFSFVNSALTNVQKKRGQFKECRVLVGTVACHERGPPDGHGSCDDTYQCSARAWIVADAPLSNRYLVDR